MKIAVIVLLVLALCLVGGGAWLYTPDKPEAALETKYASPGEFLPVAGMRLHVRDSGPKDAPAVIMLHGFGASLLTWEPWAKALEGDHRIIRFDLPGFALSGPDPTGDYGDQRSLQVVLALMDELGLARASLVGNSIGGRIAWKFAVEHPDRVDKLVLVSPDGFTTPGEPYGTRPVVPSFVTLMRYVLPSFMVKQSLAPAYGDPSRVTDELVAQYRDLMLAPGIRDAMIARMEQSVQVDPEPLLRRVQAPTLLVWGEKDGMIPFTNAADYTRLLPDSTLAPFPTLGHVPHEEAPDLSIVPVKAFLAP